MEERTQIKFSTPDIEGNPKPQLISLDQETPIEGVSEREDGEPFTWHKWLCKNYQYFMASHSLDGMLKLIPSKMGRVLKIEKVVNPKGGHPFFQIDGMNKDQIITKVAQTPSVAPIDPLSSPSTPPSDDQMDRIEQKLDKVIELFSVDKKNESAELPF